MFSSKFNSTKETIPLSILSKKEVFFRRVLLFSLVIFSSIFATIKWIQFMPSSLNVFVHYFLIILFYLTFSWIALYFFSSVFGFFVLLKNKKNIGIITSNTSSPIQSKTAILIPTYNEDPAQIFSRILSMAMDLNNHNLGDFFDFFVLSDSTNSNIWLKEEALWLETKRLFPSSINLFYRHRAKNTARKSGNIEDFCVRWGYNYDFMLILDADSLMKAKTIMRMVKLMEVNTTTGIIQAPPVIVNSKSFFARMNQFAGRVYGQIVSAGLSFWQAWDSNYWGHNAIIRTKAFIDSCGLPVFKGKAPFGGHILSHDFVEAALIRRAGWLAWMLPELKGSYEECPPTMLDFAIRDRRWCQGNLQHIRILFSQKLHPISRLHFLLGIMSYLSSLLWCLFLIFGISVPIWNYFFPPAYFSQSKELFPSWPVFDLWGTITLFSVSMTMLIFPKILGAIFVSFNEAKNFGGVLGIWFSFFFETLFSILMAPIMMLFQSKFIIEILLGIDSGWNTQNRNSETSFIVAFKRHWIHTLIGIFTMYVVYKYVPNLFYWILPITIGLVLSIPLSILSSREWIGSLFKKFHIFITPEELKQPELISFVNKASLLLNGFIDNKSTIEILNNQIYLASHIFLLSINGPMPDFSLKLRDEVRRKVKLIINGQSVNLSNDEEKYLLYDIALLKELILI